MSRPFSFALGGGLDEATQPLTIDPGRVIAVVNHEVVDGGYGRIAGFERFDGRTGPTDFPFYKMQFQNGSVQIAAGDTILGQTSGATGVVLVDVNLDDGAWDGSGIGTIGFRSLTGGFTVSETILVGGSPVGTVTTAEERGAAATGDDAEEAMAEAARDYARSLINEVPGSGEVRGVWEFDGAVYAFRDNSLATSCAMFKSTAAGWEIVNLGQTIDYTSGSGEIFEGDIITGATSGATAMVERVVLQSGDWGGGDAAGYLTLSSITGTFVAENLDVGASSNVATIGGAPVATTLPAGGRYFFVTHNFYGASGSRRVYGCNGVGHGFEFDGNAFTPIKTGMVADTPTRVAVFRNQLFFAFPNGSVQHSSPGEPTGWEAILGAAELSIGSDVADFITDVDSLTILGEHGIFILSGFDVSDWILSPLTLEAGALPYTGQRIGTGIYLDNRGLRSIKATQAYGNFTMGTISAQVQKTLRRKRSGGAAACASVIVRTKNHYRLFFSDGTGLSFYVGRKFPEAMYFDLGKVVTCISSNESPDQVERVFFGSDDGFVYQLDKGSSFDGGSIEAFLQLAYTHCGAPQILKRVHKISLEVSASAGTPIGVAAEFDYSSNEQPATSADSVTTHGVGGLLGVAQYGDFYWSSPSEDIADAYVEGQGRNVSTIIYSNSNQIAPYELRGATLYFGTRGQIR